MTDEELEKVARAALPYGHGESRVLRIQTRWNNAHEDRFTDAMTPATALALLERVRKAEARVEDLEAEVKEWEDAAARFL